MPPEIAAGLGLTAPTAAAFLAVEIAPALMVVAVVRLVTTLSATMPLVTERGQAGIGAVTEWGRAAIGAVLE